MLPMKAVRLMLGELLAADVASLWVIATPPEIVLIQSNFALDENLAMGDLTVADFDGSTPLAVGAAPEHTGIDPLTGDQMVTLKDPAGGWRWETTGLTNLPQTIYGAALTNAAGTVLHAVHLFEQPIQLQAIGEEVNIGSLSFRFVAQPMS